MINQGNNVPEKTIVIFPSLSEKQKIDGNDITREQILKIISPSQKKRDWFTPHFYRCLPLTIGNQYGFTICAEYDFAFEWNGGEKNEDIVFYFDEKVIKTSGNLKMLDQVYIPSISSHFGNGIITINPPFFFKTPPSINLMTINPPNYIIPNITVMSGVVETDNLRRNFTFNLKIQMPNIRVHIPAGTPLAGFIPIPRYFADEFELKFAEDIFSKELVEEELKANDDASEYREKVEPTLKNSVGRHYMLGTDTYGNPFPDHQRA